ncbi:MAG: tail fiber domain-containing protein [Verrucomicrobiales bacterium]
MKSYLRTGLAAIGIALAVVAASPQASAQGSEFTYQGALQDGGTAANGNYDFQFTLKSALTGGSNVGSPVTVARTNTAVADGVFSVSLDFGAAAFDGSNRWLEIQVRPAGVGSYTTLSPRQKLNPAPYSVLATRLPRVTDSSSLVSVGTNLAALGEIKATYPQAVVSFVERGGSTIWQWNADDTKAKLTTFGEGPGDVMTIDKATGNIGFGTNSPDVRLDVNGILRLRKSDLLFREPQGGATVDTNHGIGYYGVGKPFDGNSSIDGPVVYGYGGGALGSSAQEIALRWTRNGNVGIGTTTPSAPLHVAGGQSRTFNLQAYMDSNGAFNTDQTRSDLSHSIVAELRILAREGFDTESDARIKTVEGEIEGESALADVLRLRPVDYHYVDQVTRASGLQRGFLAQEVEKVIPGAILQYQQFIPNIYEAAQSCAYDDESGVATVEVTKPHDLKVGDLVRVVLEAGPVETEVTALPTPTEFCIEIEEGFEKAFVYGKQVDDFRTVDYDRIFTTGIAAMQELKRQKDAEVAALEKSLDAKAAAIAKLEGRLAEQGKSLKDREAGIAALESRLEKLEARDKERDAKVAALEKLIANGAVPAAFQREETAAKGGAQ